MPGVNNERAENDNAGTRQQLKVPIRTVVTIAINGIRIRFWRSMVTAAGIVLGIAFLSYVVTNIVSNQHMTTAEHYQAVWLGVMSLLVSFVGIMNSMLMSVTERFREIGTMKCLGAPDDFVVALFIVEGAFTGIIASVVGWLVGFLMSVGQKAMSGIPPAGWNLSFKMGVELAGACILVGAVMTLFATILPARQASIMPAAAALRTEV